MDASDAWTDKQARKTLQIQNRDLQQLIENDIANRIEIFSTVNVSN